jgi:hypothetical protein
MIQDPFPLLATWTQRLKKLERQENPDPRSLEIAKTAVRTWKRVCGER